MSEKSIMLLNNMLYAGNKILSVLAEFKSAEEFYSHPLAFDAVLMNFVVIGEMANKLSKESKDELPTIDWPRVIAFRNLIAHDYFGIDQEEVWQIATEKLPLLMNTISDHLKLFDGLTGNL